MLKKLERVIFYLLIFAVPVQSRLILHEWTQPFNQWTSAYLYGTDILLAAIFIFWLVRNLRAATISNLKLLISKQIPNPKSRILNSPAFWLTVFFVVSAISIFNSRITGLSLYQLLKLAEFIGFFFYLKSNLGKTFHFRQVLVAIITSGFLQAIIGIVQYAKQGSAGLGLLGESPLSVNATGVAVFIADGGKYLRAYGTTPHPNILAAWLFVAIFAFYYFYIYRLSGPSKFDFNKWGPGIYAVILLGFLFTFSRVIVGLWALGILIRFLLVFFKNNFSQNLAVIRRQVLVVSLVSAIVCGIFALLYWPQVQSRIYISAREEAVAQRVFYNKIAESVATSHPLLGVGIGQFVPNFISKFKRLPPTAYQPVHNFYLLVASETGFIGLGAFILFLFFTFWQFIRQADFKKLYTFSFLIFVLSFLLVGLFDHFLWTSQQGNLVFWMTLALLAKPA